MSRPAASREASAVSLFPFLAVLLCTMGSLLVLLVVLAQRATEQAAQERASHQVDARPSPLQRAGKSEVVPEPPVDPELLTQAQTQRERLQQAAAEAARRVEEAKQRLQHLEEHNRRVEHDLAKLHVANHQLQAVENELEIDQVRAEQELVRLNQLIEDVEARVAKARDASAASRRQAIIVYRGAGGTERPPVYVECSDGRVMLQPEGIPFDESDFQPPVRGNALALAIRATQDYAVRQRRPADPTGETPYPLIIVTPSGRKQFNRVSRALNAADLDYGYEFVGSETDLRYPPADPQLAQIQSHAIMQARARQERLAMAAPVDSAIAEAPPTVMAASLVMRSVVEAGAPRALWANQEARLTPALARPEARDPAATRRPNRIAITQTQIVMPSVGAAVLRPSEVPKVAACVRPRSKTWPDSTVPAATLPETATVELPRTVVGRSGARASRGPKREGQEMRLDRLRPPPPPESNQRMRAAPQPAAARRERRLPTPPRDRRADRPGTPNRNRHQGRAQPLPINSRSTARPTAGAPTGPRGGPQTVAVRRPIQVLVHQDMLVVLPSRYVSDPASAPQAAVSLNQPADKVLDQFVEAVRKHMDDWGLAGRGMQWRPVLVLNVTGDGQTQAVKLARALDGSGIDVQLPATANLPQGASRGPR